jgi:hypothetical protein
MKKIVKWIKNLFKPKVLVEDIEEILNFEWDKREMQTSPKTLRAKEYWMKEWYYKCEKINALIQKHKNKK